MLKLLEDGCRVCVPEICDYELRREYIRLNKVNPGKQQPAIDKLNELKNTLSYIPLNTSAMLDAAHLWADSMAQHEPVDDVKELNVDVILAAQGRDTAGMDHLIVATTNPKHLRVFVDARPFHEISAN